MLRNTLLTALQLSLIRAAPEQTRPRSASQGDALDNVAINEARYVVSVDSATASLTNPHDIQTLLSWSVPIRTRVIPTGTQQILPSLSDKTPDTTGTIPTQLELQGRPTFAPLVTASIPVPTSTIVIDSTMSNLTMPKNRAGVPGKALAANIFSVPIGTSAPPIPARNDHPVPRKGVVNGNHPVGTNKFYANFFLSTQLAPTFLHPYVVNWGGGQSVAASWGLAVSHVEASQRVYGPTNTAGANSYFINPLNIQSIILSAAELGSSTTLTTDQITDMSVLVQLRPTSTSVPLITFPLVQGAGYITANYDTSTPIIQTGVFFRTVTKVASPGLGVVKYQIVLEDGRMWLLYALASSGAPLSLQVVNNGLIRAQSNFKGTIQIAKNPGNGAEAIFDASCMSYATGVTLSGTTSGMRGTYAFTFKKAGVNTAPLLMFALPHHIDSFTSATSPSVKTALQLQTTTKGLATAVLSNTWTMEEDKLPVTMSFVPWSPARGSMTSLSQAARARIRATAVSELSQDIDAQTNLNSMYFSGKALAKFAMILSVVNDMLGDKALAAAGVAKLKTAFARFVNNNQQFPLAYDSAWGGLVSSASYGGDSGADFGNTYYNDHHFHYGYFVLTAAVIGHIDSSWISANKPYVDGLVRDYANPTTQDGWFPVSRNFDWYHGHSWAHGLYEVLDGKDQESSSEDMMAAYALKMWGMVGGDLNLAARGNLMLSVMTRALNKYYLYTSNNKVQPANFIGNKVAGILFENKIDHTTYFGTNIEYIQGIHMIPLLPPTKLVRQDQFVLEEWATYFASGKADQVVGGWRGILYGNYATVNPKAAWQFFTQSNFDSSWIDGGASMTWYLAYCGTLGGF